jgi:drug/metabolite transporter (DMT)-like permease
VGLFLCRVSKASQGIYFMVISVFFFAVVNTCAKLLPALPVHELVFFRSVVSFTFSFLFLKSRGIPILGKNKKWLLIRGFTGLIALSLFFATIKNMPLAAATTIQYLSPVFTVFFAIWLNNQKVKPIQWLFFAMAISGILMIKGFDTRVSIPWLLVGVASALMAGLAYNAVIRCSETEHPVVVVMYFPLVSLPITGTWCLFDFVMPHDWDWLILLAMGTATQIAQYFATRALSSDAAGKITPWTYFGALFSMGIGYLLFNEPITMLAIVGMVVMVTAVILNARLKTKTT